MRPAASAHAEDLVARVLAYLAWSGVRLTDEVEREALLVIADVLGSDEDAFQGCLQRLAPRLEIPRAARPQAAPPIMRGSLGYAAR